MAHVHGKNVAHAHVKCFEDVVRVCMDARINEDFEQLVEIKSADAAVAQRGQLQVDVSADVTVAQSSGADCIAQCGCEGEGCGRCRTGLVALLIQTSETALSPTLIVPVSAPHSPCAYTAVSRQ